MSEDVRTTIGLAGNIYLEHPVSGYRIPRFDKVVESLRACDITLANFEACVHDSEDWPAFVAGAVGSGTYMGGPPATVDEMQFMGIDALYMANNHCTDFGERGLVTTMKHLHKRDMAYAGIGMSLADASAPVYLEASNGRRVAMISVCDWGPRGTMDMLFPWPLGYFPSDELPPFRSRPGVNLLRYGAVNRVERQTLDELRRASDYLGWERSKALRRTGMMRDFPLVYGETPDCEVDTDDEFFFMGRKFVASDTPGLDTFAYQDDIDRIVKYVREARRQADIVIVALHDQSHRQGGGVHEYVRTAAHAALDAGADVFANTGGLHRGVEIRNGKTIFWGLPSFFLQNNQITRMPSSSYAYWGLPPDSTVADLLDVRAKRAQVSSDSPQKVEVYPLTPSALHTISFDESNRVTEIRIQPYALDPDAPGFRAELPLWPSAREADEAVKRFAGMSEEFGTRVDLDDGTAVIKVS